MGAFGKGCKKPTSLCTSQCSTWVRHLSRPLPHGFVATLTTHTRDEDGNVYGSKEGLAESEAYTPEYAQAVFDNWIRSKADMGTVLPRLMPSEQDMPYAHLACIDDIEL